MAKKTKSLEITIKNEGGKFNPFFKKTSIDKKSYDFEGISTMRKLLSNEKARILNVIKEKNPKSIYDLSKILDRDFKSVSEDIKLLEKFGFIDLLKEKTGKRERLKPVVIIDSLNIQIKL
ncbi:hypothetical protein CXT76_01315 [Candidatus Parvarchaeota archaeon]|jgi:predicted transcriptional regulator|nr:MAG: hypothetical protein CXT76_01315 [Candidatus Parvarchaeota archaeon]HIG52198.1 hypothetical protein [Candidatus Pacearchaeota archaeon]